jgi:argininosuccinate lyase
MSQLWQKNESDSINRDWFFEFTALVDKKYDAHLIPFDIKCNIAQVYVLQDAGLVSEVEGELLKSTLRDLFKQWQKGEFQLNEHDEDVHSAIENYLIKLHGESGKKIHTGRSRNDQVLTDIRMYSKDRILDLFSRWHEVIAQFEEIIHNYPDTFFAGFTHTQSAMPHSVDAWAAGYIDLLTQDVESVISAYHQVDRSPLGSAAGFGVPFIPLNRQLASNLLGFNDVQHAVAGTQLARGTLEKKIMDSLGYVAHTFNRLASDIILFTSPLLGIIEISEDQTSGSSIMPQKRNPDAWELIRSTYSEIYGISAQLSMVSTNLISGYHRDLQVTKKCLIDGLNLSLKLAEAVNICLKGLHFNPDKCKESMTPEIFATHIANKLVVDGVAFRDAYKIAAKIAKETEKPEIITLKESYKVLGYPGKYERIMFQNTIKTQQSWFQKEENKRNLINKKLFNE